MPREDRAETARRERRWTPGPIDKLNLKLSLDEAKLDRDRFHYRFVNDKADRVRSLAAYDYDIAPEAAKTNDLGTGNSVHGGVEDTGRPYNMVLMRKERDWFEEDQKRKMKPLDEMDEAIRRGKEVPGQKLTGEGVYSPVQNQV